MKSPVARLVTALIVPALAALGGAGMVYSGYDDAPGGVLLGLLLVVGAAVLSVRVSRTQA